MAQEFYSEDDLLPISALQHLLFCERQCALIHVERLWVENRFTAEGRNLHRKAHEAPSETRDGVRITRGLLLRNFELGLAGVADVVTWKPPPSHAISDKTLASLLRRATADELRRWEIVPVEYKRGRPKANDCDRIQLCAQALCLEEMLAIDIPAGELFYGLKRRRFRVDFDAELCHKTRLAAQRLHQLIESRQTPPARREPKCDKCSLLEFCMPDILLPRQSVDHFVEQALATHLSGSGPVTDLATADVSQ